ncbi:ribonuclease HII [Proteinivorax hydrogeniformans]|uniref:Ribonuclease HII n=1 Tax=Proteinivorax hydrogeniformans TaxID=1826727 RepID=A0AAU8HX99_9FIRM
MIIKVQDASIQQIKQRVNESSIDQLNALIPQLKNDSRKGVQKILASLNRKINGYKSYLKLWEWEESSNYKVVGCDEAGRGPVAGPVVAAAVTFNNRPNLVGVKDSKRLNSSQREALASEIEEQALYFDVQFIDNDIIDELNILNATKLAMKNSVERVAKPDSLILIDGNFAIETKLKQKSIIKGDDKCGSIAAASILAKVYRDRYMEEMDKLYPEYGFSQNKGYPTKEHLDAIQTYGVTPIHRITFKGVKEVGKNA